MPKVSIIVPNYNHARFLEQRLESILNQTYQDFEVIFLDDASTDNSLEIFSKYEYHPKISQKIFNSENSGSPFKQWQKGLTFATGDHIWMAESDDYCELNLLEEMLPLMRGDVSLAYCRSISVDEQNVSTNSDYFWPDDLMPGRWNKHYIENGNSEIKSFFIYKNVIPNASSAIFKRQNIKFDPRILDMNYAGDWLFWINQAMNSKIAYTPKRLNYSRNSIGNTRSPGTLKKEEKRFKEYFLVIGECITTSIPLADYPIMIRRSRKWHWIFEERRLYPKKVILSLLGEKHRLLFLASFLLWHLHHLSLRIKHKFRQKQKLMIKLSCCSFFLK